MGMIAKLVNLRSEKKEIHNVIVCIIISLDSEMRICLIVPTFLLPTSSHFDFVISYKVKQFFYWLWLEGKKKTLSLCSLKCAFSLPFIAMLNFFICSASFHLNLIMTREIVIALISQWFAMINFNRIRA